MKKFKLNQALISISLALASVPASAYWCPISNSGYQALVQWHTAFNSRWQTVVAPVGNFQSAMNTAEQTINQALDKMERAIETKINQSDANIEKAIGKFTTAVNIQIQNMGAGQIAANSAIAEYENMKSINDQINKTTEDAEQPITNCLQFAAGQSLTDAFKTMKKTSSASALDLAQRAVANSSESDTQLAEYVKLKEKYVNTTDPSIKDGDVNAALLFGGNTGTLTRYSDKQDEASKDFISNIVREYDLPARIGSAQEQTINGKRYTNIQRRMATYLGLATHSLESVRANHQANGALTSFYTSAKLTPNDQIKKYGVSVSEVLNTYAEKMIGHENTAAIAGAQANTTVLRQIAQTNAMRLWVKNQKLQSAERVQALEAAKLALMAEEVLGKQAQLYQGATTN